MRKDLAELTPARSAAAIDEATDLNDRQKQDAKRQRILQLDDALAAARVLAEFSDHSGYDLALKVVKGDGHPGQRTQAVEILYCISNTDLTALRAEKLDPDGVLLALAQTEQAPGVIAAIHRCALGYWRAEIGIKIMETLVKSPYVTEKRRAEIERGLQYRKEDLAKATPDPPQKK
jgi:hypothetical protein